jgi:DNA-binding PadR family transcriptional regulator
MAVLGLLKHQDLHGYELKRRLQDVLGPQASVSFGSLYPALAKLEAGGAIEVVAREAESLPAEGTRKRSNLLQRRRRKVYRLTTSGSALFDRLLTERSAGPEDDRSFNSKLAFAAHLDPEGRLGLLEGRRRVLAGRLARVGVAAHHADKYLASLLARERESLSKDLSWIDGLIAEERSALANAGRAAPAAASSNTLVPLASTSQLRRARTPA